MLPLPLTFWHPLSTTQVAAKATGLMPMVCALLAAKAPQLWDIIVS